MYDVPKSNRYRLQRAIIRLPGLVAYYPLNETTGSVAKNYAPANKNSLNGSITETTLGQPGKVGRAYSFDGVNDEVDLGNSSSLEIGTGSASFGTLCFLENATTSKFPFASRTGFNSGGYDILVNTGVAGRVAIRIGAGDINSGTYDTTVNTWHFIVGVVNRSTDLLILYVDGVQCSTKDIANIPAVVDGAPEAEFVQNTQNPNIGKRGATFFNQKAQHVFFVNRGLTSNEILNIARIAGLA